MKTVDRGVRHRLRLLDGMTAAVARKGYETVTIADVVAEAGVSKRTFYEHFASKEACLLACYTQTASVLLATIRQQLTAREERPEPGSSMIGPVLNTYLTFLDDAPQLAPALLGEIRRAGDDGRRSYRRTSLEFALLIADAVPADERPADEFAPERVDLGQSIALIGGLNELVLTHAEDHPGVPFRTLGPMLTRFAEAVLGRSRERVTT